LFAFFELILHAESREIDFAIFPVIAFRGKIAKSISRSVANMNDFEKIKQTGLSTITIGYINYWWVSVWLGFITSTHGTFLRWSSQPISWLV